MIIDDEIVTQAELENGIALHKINLMRLEAQLRLVEALCPPPVVVPSPLV